jgi:hypothetical protein
MLHISPLKLRVTCRHDFGIGLPFALRSWLYLILHRCRTIHVSSIITKLETMKRDNCYCFSQGPLNQRREEILVWAFRQLVHEEGTGCACRRSPKAEAWNPKWQCHDCA